MLLIAAVIWVLLPFIGNVIDAGLGLSFVVIQLLGVAIFVIGMPLFFLIIGEAGYKIFFKPYIRVWRIHRIRHARLLRETLDHDGTEN